MFAVVKLGGNQYRAALGDTLTVGLLSAAVGDTVSVPALLVVDGENIKVAAQAAQVPVVVKILSHGKGEKIHIRRFLAKSRHRRHIGFRAALTTVSVESIGEVKKVATSEKPKKAQKTKKVA